MSIKADVAAGVRWTSLAALSRVLLLLVRLSVLTRLLSPRDFGLMSLVTLVLGYAQSYVELGFSNAIIQKRDTTPSQLSTLFWLNVGAGMLVAAVVVFSRGAVAELFHDGALAELLLPCALVFPLAGLEQQFRALYTRELEFARVAIVQMVSEAAGLVIAIVAALEGAGVMSLIYAYIASAAIRALCMFVPGIRRWPIRFHFRLGEVSEHIRFGVFQLLQYTLNYLTSNVDTLVIGRYLGADVLGLYTLATRLVRLPQRHISPVLAKVAMPAFARQQKNLPALRRGLINIQRALAYATLPMLVGAYLTREDLVPILYGSERMDLVPVLGLLVWPGLFQALTGSMGAVHLALGRVRFLFHWAAFSLAIWGAAMYSSALSGFEALLWARVAAGVSLSIVFAGLTFRAVDASLRESAISLSRPALCTALMALSVVPVSFAVAGLPAAVALALQVGVGALTFGAAAWFVDNAFIRELWRLLTKRGR